MKLLTLSLWIAISACSHPEPAKPDADSTPPSTPAGTPTSTGITVPPVVHQNLLVISIDTLRRDHLPRYDSEQRNLMPFLDQRMDEGVVADAHHPGANWTYQSFSTSLAGRYPLDSGVLTKLSVDDWRGWPAGTRFVADELHDQQFTTVMASANGWLGPGYGLGGSYDTYVGRAFDASDITYGLGVDALQAQIDAGTVGRWYLHLHFLEPHAPYIPPAEYRIGEDLLAPSLWDLDSQPGHYGAVGQYPNLPPDERALLLAHMNVRYDGELRWLDDRLRDFWTDLDSRGWLDDTLVVFWSDHGEQFFERGNQSHGFHLGAEESTGMFFLWSKQLEPASLTLRTSGIDIAPTILAGLGVQAPATWTGVPMGELEAGRPVFADANARLGVVQSVTLGTRHLIYQWTGETHFYHLDTDPEMLVERYSPLDPEVVELWDLLRPRVQMALVLQPGQVPVAPQGLSL